MLEADSAVMLDNVLSRAKTGLSVTQVDRIYFTIYNLQFFSLDSTIPNSDSVDV